jgi:anti-sigma regulatory factor (Ser/Thr protein kinase)
MTHAIKLEFPHERAYLGVARLVVGGLAARLDLSYENLEDLQLALASILENDAYVLEPEVTVELDVGEDLLAMVVGPVNGDLLRTDLKEEGEDRIGLGRLLGTLVDEVSVESRDGNEWLRLEKRVRLLRSEEAHGRG